MASALVIRELEPPQRAQLQRGQVLRGDRLPVDAAEASL
jgi:hypothetical protein